MSLQWTEQSCDIVARFRLVRYISSSLIGGGRLFNTLLSVMLSFVVVVVIDLPLLRVAVEGSDNPVSPSMTLNTCHTCKSVLAQK